MRTNTTRTRTTFARALAGLLAVTMASPLWAAPGDITSVPAPMLGSDPPKAKDIADGDASVSTQTGALEYSFPIEVPDGRLGMAPKLALSYSSQGSTYGGVASGWSLSIPQIRLDTSESLLKQRYWAGLSSDPWQRERFTSSLSGGRPLVPVTESFPLESTVYQAFRAQNDSGWVRYERMKPGQPYLWRAKTPDGVTHYFGDTNLGAWSSDVVNLTRSVDSFGNTIEYDWSAYQISQIRYTSNPAAGLPSFARIEFDYTTDTCGRVPVGAQEDRRLNWIDGEKRLTKIRAISYEPSTGVVDHTREYTLGYDMDALSCTARHAPLRLLKSIQQSAWGPLSPIVALPPVTFDYNRLERQFDAVQMFTAPGTPWIDWINTDSSTVSSGKRPPFGWPEVQEMMLDFDGDGLVDRITLGDGTPNECTFRWQKNLGKSLGGNYTFGIEIEQVMPRLPWESGTKGPTEICALNFQYTKRGNVLDPASSCQTNNGTYLAYRWTDITGDGLVDLVAAVHHDYLYDPNNETDPTFFQRLKIAPWAACEGDGGACPVVSSSCVADSIVCKDGEGCAPHEPAIAECMSESPVTTCDRLMRDMDQYGPRDPDQNELGPSWPDGPPPSADCNKKKEHQRCDRFPWFVYENEGGAFEALGEVKYQPIPLESDSGDSSMGGGGSHSSTAHALQDIDGDGYMDLAVRGKTLEGVNSSLIWWFVYRGDGTGGFLTHDSGYPYMWYVPQDAHISGSCPSMTGTLCTPSLPSATDFTIPGYTALTDLNGDGAVDFAWTQGDGTSFQTHGYWNEGLHFSNYGFGPSETVPPPGDLVGANVDGLSRSWVHATTRNDPWGPYSNWLITGWRQGHAQSIDVDDDGRPDLVGSQTTNYPQFPFPTSVRFNDGGTFLAAHDLNQLPNLQAGLMQRTEATGHQADARWAVKWDLIDMDGDGLPEQWKFPIAPGQNVSVRRDSDTQPLRLLKRIDNGRGGTVTATYASTNDPGDTVTQDAASRKAVPKTQWVVSALTTLDRWDTDTSVTTYEYTNPIWNRDERGNWGFRGFEEVRSSTPSGAVSLDTYDYVVDWSGRLASTRLYASATDVGPQAITETVWEPRILFGGAITTYHAARERKWTCENGQTQAACQASTGGRVETINTLEQLPVSGPAQMLVVGTTYTTNTGVYSVGDRKVVTSRQLYVDADDYRVQTLIERAYEKRGETPSVEAMISQVFYGFDATFRFKELELIYFTETVDPNGYHRAITRWTYDLGSGVKLTAQSPRHYPSGPVETYGYEATKRFVTTTTNEKGHVVERKYHPGTGTVLIESGPSSSSCGTNCTNTEKTWTDIDGLGRPTAIWVNRAVMGNAVWQKTQIGRYKYTDGIGGGARTKVETGSLIDYDSNRWTYEQTELDGRGRADIVTTTTGGAANAVTSYDYDHRGHVVAVTMPDPSQNTAATVTYAYGYDSLGRPTSMRRPAVGGTAASGVDLTYNGLVHSRSEVVGSQGGPGARTVLVHDAFARLKEVREYTSPTVFKSTFYDYDGNDNVRRIQNPDGVVTELEHDFEGRRTKITRHGRIWKYGYWPTGEMMFETVPHGTGSPVQSTTTYGYDLLGRESSRAVGVRALSASEQSLYGVGTITFGYDTCLNGVGRLCTATHPYGVLTTTYQYDAEGNVASDNRVFKFAGFTANRFTSATFGPSGRVVTQTYGDHQAGVNNGTVARFEYDERALPKTLKWQNGAVHRTVATQARNTAGLVTVRHTQFGTTGWNESQSEWTYDALTRVKSQRIVQGQGGFGVEFAKQELDYFGQDDPKRLQHWLRRSSTSTGFYDMTFGYDQRHQLTSVTEAANRYSANFYFTDAGKMSRATVGGAPGPGNDVVARDVNYTYNPASGYDPDAPTGLTNVSNGTAFRSFNYDYAGNITQRSGLTTPYQIYYYDGEDQLRVAWSNTSGVWTREEYFYDHSGSRAGIVKRNSSGQVVDVRVFFGEAEALYSPAGTLTQTFAYLSMGTPVAKVTNRADLELQYHGLANSTLLTLTPSGTTKSGFVYAPFGELIESTGTALADQRRRFNDKYRDDLTKLSYYGARYYDNVLLTWTQADPLFRFAPDIAWAKPRLAGLYVFTLNNPVRYVDPDGRTPLVLAPLAPEAVAVGGGIVAAVSTEVVASAAAIGMVIGAMIDPPTFAPYSPSPPPPPQGPDHCSLCSAGPEAVAGTAGLGGALVVSLASQHKPPTGPADTTTQTDAPTVPRPTAQPSPSHTKGKRGSTADKHSKKRPGAPEKGDARRRPPDSKPKGWEPSKDLKKLGIRNWNDFVKAVKEGRVNVEQGITPQGDDKPTSQDNADQTGGETKH